MYEYAVKGRASRALRSADNAEMVSVWVDHESTIVIRRILRSVAGCSVVPTALGQGDGVETKNCLVIWGGEADMKTVVGHHSSCSIVRLVEHEKTVV